MTDSGKTQYTPGQSVTLIDAEGKRGLGQISDTTISVRVDFDHIDSNGAVIEAGSRWPLSRLKAFGLQILPEPFTEPKDADRLSEDGYRWGDVAAALGGTITEPKGEEIGDYGTFTPISVASQTAQSSSGDSDKPLTAGELTKVKVSLAAIIAETGGSEAHGPLWPMVERLLAMARSSLSASPDALSQKEEGR